MELLAEWAALSNGSEVISEGRKLDAGDSVPAMVHERGKAYSGTQSEQKQNLWPASHRALVGRDSVEPPVAARFGSTESRPTNQRCGAIHMKHRPRAPISTRAGRTEF